VVDFQSIEVLFLPVSWQIVDRSRHIGS
jgi:hypothetical protein